MSEALVRYLHFLGIIVFASMLVAEHILAKGRLSSAEIRRLALFDMVYGLSAIVVFGAGLTLWLWVGKPSGFYSGNPIFVAKVGAFILLGLLSIYPTTFFVRQRRLAAESVDVPKLLVWCVRLESLLLVIIPLLAVLMARGIGLNR